MFSFPFAKTDSAVRWLPQLLDCTTMDRPQVNAVLDSMQRELALVQGPPGTGKTYVGVQIVRAILANLPVSLDDATRAPIVVVCLTNHALDSFLEDLVKAGVSDNIVRVGGRSKSKELEKFSLDSVRRGYGRSGQQRFAVGCAHGAIEEASRYAVVVAVVALCLPVSSPTRSPLFPHMTPLVSCCFVFATRNLEELHKKMRFNELRSFHQAEEALLEDDVAQYFDEGLRYSTAFDTGFRGATWAKWIAGAFSKKKQQQQGGTADQGKLSKKQRKKAKKEQEKKKRQEEAAANAAVNAANAAKHDDTSPDPWRWSPARRQAKLKRWLAYMKQEVWSAELRTAERRHARARQGLMQLYDTQDVAVLRRAHIVGFTTNGLASRLVSECTPTVVVSGY